MLGAGREATRQGGAMHTHVQHSRDRSVSGHRRGSGAGAEPESMIDYVLRVQSMIGNRALAQLLRPDADKPDCGCGGTCGGCGHLRGVQRWAEDEWSSGGGSDWSSGGGSGWSSGGGSDWSSGGGSGWSSGGGSDWSSGTESTSDWTSGSTATSEADWTSDTGADSGDTFAMAVPDEAQTSSEGSTLSSIGDDSVGDQPFEPSVVSAAPVDTLIEAGDGGMLEAGTDFVTDVGEDLGFSPLGTGQGLGESGEVPQAEPVGSGFTDISNELELPFEGGPEPDPLDDQSKSKPCSDPVQDGIKISKNSVTINAKSLDEVKTKAFSSFGGGTVGDLKLSDVPDFKVTCFEPGPETGDNRKVGAIKVVLKATLRVPVRGKVTPGGKGQ